MKVRSFDWMPAFAGMTVLFASNAFAAAPVEDLTQQDGGRSGYYNDAPPSSAQTQGAGETPTFRSANPAPAPSAPAPRPAPSISVDLATRIDRLQAELDRLRGQVEVQDHKIKQLTDQLRAQYQDLDQRLSQSPKKITAQPLPAERPRAKTQPDNIDTLEPATTTTATPKKTARPAVNTPDNDNISDPEAAAADMNNAAPSTASNPQNEKKEYDAAIGLLKKQDYVRATTQLQRYLRDYPNGKYTASSHFWLGKIYSYQGQPDLAISEYNTVITNYPKDPKMPNALLELGFAYDEAGDWEQAKTQLNKVIRLFPKTETAQKAEARLQKIKRQGL